MRLLLPGPFMPIFFFFFALLLAIEPFNAKLLISSNHVAALVDCHEKFVKLEGHKISSADLHDMGPFFHIDAHFRKCLPKIKDSNGTPVNLHNRLFTISGFNEWISVERQRLMGVKNEIEQNLKGTKKNEKLEEWRKKVFSLGMALEAGYLLVGISMIDDKFMENVQKVPKLDAKKYERMLKQLKERRENLEYMLRDGDPERNPSPNKEIGQKIECFQYSKYEGIKEKLMEKMRNEVEMDRKMPSEFGEHWWTEAKDVPKAKRILWVVRHAERYDNIEPKLRDKSAAHKVYEEDPRLFWWDNSPLSPRGKERQSPKLAEVFKEIPIKHIFASPMERTVDTATRILDKYHGNLTIKLEPGFIERLDQCTAPNPSYQSCDELFAAGYHRVDCEYRSLYRKMDEQIEDFNKLYKTQFVLDSTKEGIEHNENDVMERVKNTLEHVLENYGNDQCGAGGMIEKTDGKWIGPGEENAALEHILIVTHGSVTGAIHQLIAGHWAYVAQASISKFVEYEEPGSGYSANDGARSSNKQNNKKNGINKFRRILTSETKHLVKEREHNLRYC